MTDAAVNCRNHFVHGSVADFDYESDGGSGFAFITEALEFVFAAAELVEAGWDIEAWTHQGSTGIHPFGLFCSHYRSGLAHLKSIFPKLGAAG